jgi:hypothetical protein
MTRKLRLQTGRFADGRAQDAQTEKKTIEQPMPPPIANHQTTALGAAYPFQSHNAILDLFDVVSAKNETMSRCCFVLSTQRLGAI